MNKTNNDWDTLLSEEYKKPYFVSLEEFLAREYKEFNVFPAECDIFNSLNLTPYKNVKVVILGQDPYHGYNEAHGLCFSVNASVKLPPSLKNIYKEILSDTNSNSTTCGNLSPWATQGVLLLNTVLTVRENEPNSHKNHGWEIFTDAIIALLNNRTEPIIFLLWGNNAKQKLKLINNQNHIVLTAAHPSPLSAHNGFFGCKHFSKANAMLLELQSAPIIW